MLYRGVEIKYYQTNHVCCFLKHKIHLFLWARRYLEVRIMQLFGIANTKTLLNFVSSIWYCVAQHIFYITISDYSLPCLSDFKDEGMFLIIWLPSVVLKRSISQPPSQPGGLRITWQIRPLQFAVNWLYAPTLSRHGCHGNLICMAQKTPEKQGLAPGQINSGTAS